MLIADYLRRLANWLDPPRALNVYVHCDTSQAVAALTELQKAYQDMLDKLDWSVKS